MIDTPKPHPLPALSYKSCTPQAIVNQRHRTLLRRLGLLFLAFGTPFFILAPFRHSLFYVLIAFIFLLTGTTLWVCGIDSWNDERSAM